MKPFAITLLFMLCIGSVFAALSHVSARLHDHQPIDPKGIAACLLFAVLGVCVLNELM